MRLGREKEDNKEKVARSKGVRDNVGLRTLNEMESKNEKRNSAKKNIKRKKSTASGQFNQKKKQNPVKPKMPEVQIGSNQHLEASQSFHTQCLGTQLTGLKKGC